MRWRLASTIAAIGLLCPPPTRAQAPPNPFTAQDLGEPASGGANLSPPVEELSAAPAELTLADLEQVALSNNPSLAVAAARIGAARGAQVQAGLCPNPSLGYYAMDMGEDGTAGQQGAYASQQFITGGKLRLGQAEAGWDIARARRLLDAQELRVLTDVRTRFYEGLAAQRQADLTGELVGISRKFTDISATLEKSGQLSESDRLQAEVESQEAQILLDNARNQRDEALRRLSAVAATPLDPEQRLAGDLEADLAQHEWNDAYCWLLARSPELQAARARVQKSRVALQLARQQVVPNVDVMVNVTHMFQTDDEVVGVQAGIPTPIFNKNQGNIMRASAELAAAANDVRRIELDLQDRLAVAFRSYETARQQAHRYRTDILPRANESLRLMGRGYEVGQGDFLPLLTVQRTYIRVNLAYLQSLAELRKAAAAIDGQLLSGSLQAEAAQ